MSNNINNNNKFKSFRDLQNKNNNHESDSDEEKNFFTGGERSGLEVEKPPDSRDNNPQRILRELLAQAARNGERPDINNNDEDDEEDFQLSHFKGSGYRLGTEDTPSEVINNPNERIPERITRTCTFWKNGFTIDDGELFPYSDPQNVKYMEQMKNGSAPLLLFNVLPGQRVDINVRNKENENYKPPKNLAKFSGSGHRLGSPVPGEIVTEPIIDNEPTVESRKTLEPSDPNIEDDKQTTIQVRFADGRKLKVVVLKKGPVQQVFDFVDSMFKYGGGKEENRDYYLSLSYPVKPITDKEISIEDAKLVRSVVIQRWS